MKKTSERIFLDETFLNGKKINLGAKSFIVEAVDNNALRRAMENPDEPLFLYGTLQSGDTPNRNGRIYPWTYLKRECLRYMDNEVANGLSYGECFAEGHQVFTKRGWVNFKDTKEDEIVATMNPVTKEFEWQPIMRRVEYDYSGDMIHLHSKTFDVLTTPQHKFFVTRTYNHNKFDSVYAKDLNSSHLIPKKFNWVGQTKETLKLETIYGTLDIDTKLFCEFMGWYLAEGWYEFKDSNSSWNVSLSQKKISGVNEIKNLLEKLNWEYSENIEKETQEHTFMVTNKVLAAYCLQFGKCRDKFVPEIIKELNQECIQIFLDAFSKGDGNMKELYTTSRFLMNDLTELVHKTNGSTNVTEEEQFQLFYTVKNLLTGEEKEINNFDYYTKEEYNNKEDFEITSKRKFYTNTKLYIISRRDRNYYSVEGMTKEVVQYTGKVYCVEVPNHIILVKERTGKSLIINQCDHPEDSTSPSLKNACWCVEDISFKNKDVEGKLKVLNAFMPEIAPGKLIRGLILNNKGVGISSRALGSLQEDTGSEYDIVAEDLEMICWDAVSNASNFGSEKLRVNEETKKKKYKLLTESQAFGTTKRVNLIERKLTGLNERERLYLNILGIEKFLRLYA